MSLSILNLIRVVAASFVLVAPGFLLQAAILKPRPWWRPAHVAVAAILGLGLLGLVLQAAAWLNLPLRMVATAWAIFGGVSFVAGLAAYRLREREMTSGGRLEAPETGAARHDLWLLAALLVGAVLTWIRPMAISGGADVWDYLNRASAMVRSDSLLATSPYSPGLNNPYGPVYYGLLAAVRLVSGIPFPEATTGFAIFATLIEIGAIAFAASTLTRSGAVGAGVAVVYALLYGVFFLYDASIHHQILGDTLLLTGLSVLFLYVRSGGASRLVVGALCAAAAPLFHHFLLIETAFTIGVAGLLLAWKKGHDPFSRRRALLFVATAAVALFPAAFHLLTAHAGKLDRDSMDTFFVTLYAPLWRFGPLSMPDPFAWYFRGNWHVLPAVPVLFYFGRRLIKDSRLLVLGTLLVLPIFLVLNPLVFPVLAGLLSMQVATRILNLTTYPGAILLGWALVEGLAGREVAAVEAESGFSAVPARRSRSLAWAAVSMALILPQMAVPAWNNFAPEARFREWVDSPLAWRGGLETLGARAGAGQIVLSDPVTSYSIPTFAPLYIVGTGRTDFAYQAEDVGERQAAIRTVLAPLSSPDSTLMALRRFEVDWVLVNRRFTNPVTLNRLDRLDDYGLQKRFEAADLVAYAVDRTITGPAPSPPDSGEDLLPAARFLEVRRDSPRLVFDQEAGIGGLLEAAEAGYRDTLRFVLFYEKREGEGPVNYWPKLLREAAYGSTWKKVERRLRVMLTGREDSFLPRREPDYPTVRASTLPAGVVFPDSFEVPVYRDLVRGRYALYVGKGSFPSEGRMGIKLGEVEIGPRQPGIASN